MNHILYTSPLRLQHIRYFSGETTIAIGKDIIKNRIVLLKELNLRKGADAVYNHLRCENLGIEVPILYYCHNFNDKLIIEYEYISGKDLYYQLDDNPFGTLPVLNIITQLLEKVKCYRKHNLSHLDLKLENLIWNMDTGILRVIDFDTMREHSNKGKLTRVNHRIGTRGYSSPEVLLTSHFHRNTDLWHIGLIGYILVMGYNPIDDCCTTRHGFQKYAREKLRKEISIDSKLYKLIISFLHPNPIYRSLEPKLCWYNKIRLYLIKKILNT